MQKELRPIVENIEKEGIKRVKYLSAESNYENLQNRIHFTLGEFNNQEGFGSTSFISCSVEDACDFAKSILKLCNYPSEDNQ
jgi:hypothetical protein